MAKARKTPSKSKNKKVAEPSAVEDAVEIEAPSEDVSDTQTESQSLEADTVEDVEVAAGSDPTNDTKETENTPEAKVTEVVEEVSEVDESAAEMAASEETPSDVDVPDVPGALPALELAEETEQTNETPPPPAPPAKSVGMSGFLFAGIVAGIIGFAAAYFTPTLTPVEEVVDHAPTIAALEEEVAALQGQLETSSQESAAEIEGLEQELSELRAEFEALPRAETEESTSLLTDELQAALVAQKEELVALQDDLNRMAEFAKTQIADAEAEQANAAQAEARAKARGAVNVVRDALTSGDGFAEVLDDIAPAADVPEGLLEVAETGVASQQSLEESFPGAARTALSASLRETSGDAPADRFKLFLKDQLGGRSLTPKDGDDPDAVLSRAEAAVKGGGLGDAIELISLLPETGQAALSDWANGAQQRLDALAGLETLENALSAD